MQNRHDTFETFDNVRRPLTAAANCVRQRPDRRSWTFSIVLAFALCTVGLAQQYHVHDEHPVDADQPIGYVNFQVSCDEPLKGDFDRALGLMHHMMYEQAREGFQEILSTEPSCAMAYWGVATTLFQPLWPSRPNEATLMRGWENIEQARALDKDPREAVLIEATGAFFADPETAEYWTRIDRWADGMQSAYQTFPDDLDIAALYSLSRIAIAPLAQDGSARSALFDEAERVLRNVFEQAELHPGAIHYSIHATDVDGRAANALDMVALYGEIAPHVPHALHMPTHIYVRLGEWPGVIDWNRRSADAALQFPVGDRVSLHYIHALDYMLYGYLQQGDDISAQTVLEEALAVSTYQEDFAAAFHLAIMPARFAVERREWNEAVNLQLNQPEYLQWTRYTWPQAITMFARGLGAVMSDRLDEAKEAESGMATLRDQAMDAGERAFGTYIEIDRLILSGWIARADGDAEAAVSFMQEAAALEGTVEKHPVTPGALLPPYEALGDLLFDLGRFEEALDAYSSSDDRWPSRFHTLLGAARAAQAAGDDETARVHAARLIAVAGSSERPDLAEARALATQ